MFIESKRLPDAARIRSKAGKLEEIAWLPALAKLYPSIRDRKSSWPCSRTPSNGPDDWSLAARLRPGVPKKARSPSAESFCTAGFGDRCAGRGCAGDINRGLMGQNKEVGIAAAQEVIGEMTTLGGVVRESRQTLT